MASKTGSSGKSLGLAQIFRKTRILRRVCSFAYACYAWIVFLICTGVFGTLAVVLRKPSLAQRVLKTGARLMCRLGGIALSIEGEEHLPARPHVLILNHTSFMDPIALLALLPPRPAYRFAARQQFRRQSVLGPLVKSAGTIILKRPDQHHHLSNVELLAQALRAGDKLLLFPEGGFSPEPGLHAFHSGAFVAARQENAPVVVACIQGAADVLRPRSWLPRRHPVRVLVGPVLYPQGTAEVPLEVLMQAAQSAMAQLQEQPGKSSRPSG
ncbi:MAG: lysophospholipid acyltransferase family protein [Burkholderiaceae bacterium]